MFNYRSAKLSYAFVILLLIAQLALPISTAGSQSRTPPKKVEPLSIAIEQLLRQRPLASESQPAKSERRGLETGTKPPADDAPIDDLIEFWTRRSIEHRTSGSLEPSEVVRERLLGAAERRPWILPRLYDFLPQNSETHDRLYRVLTKDPKEFEDIDEKIWNLSLYWWLQSNTGYLRDELIEAVRTRDNSNPDKSDEIEALSKLDWNTAKPLLEKIVGAGQSISYPMALSKLYEGSIKDNDLTLAENYRTILKRLLVENDISQSARRTILQNLLHDEWNGQEDWFVTLFDAPNLSRPVQSRMIATGSVRYIGGRRISDSDRMRSFQRLYYQIDPIPLSVALSANSGKWIPIIAGLTGHKDATVRTAAISALSAFLENDRSEKKAREDAARALLPWLTDPSWGGGPSRANYIYNLADYDIPESIPGLLRVLEVEQDDFTREAVVAALRRHCDSRVAPVLKALLPTELNAEVRRQIVTSLANCGGLSNNEMVTAIAAYAEMAATIGGQAKIEEIHSGESGKTLPPNVAMGETLLESEMKWATESFAATLFDRLKELSPAAARLILNRIRSLPLNIARVKLVERISQSSADLADLKLALSIRDTLTDELRNELSDLIKRGGYAAGIAAIALEDHGKSSEILKGGDAKAQIALIAGARYLRDALPIDLMRNLIVNPDKTLAQAVENYLEILGGVDAQKIILARHSDGRTIVGDITCLAEYQNELADLKVWESKLSVVVQTSGSVEEIFTLKPVAPSNRLKGIVIHVRSGKAEVSVYDTTGNPRSRSLTEAEFRELIVFTSRPEVEGLGPESWKIRRPTIPYEYLHLTKDGGRRIVLAGFDPAPKSPSLHEKLSDLFYRIAQTP